MESLQSLRKKAEVKVGSDILIGPDVVLSSEKFGARVVHKTMQIIEDLRPLETDALRDEAIREWYDRSYQYEQLYDIAMWEDRLVHTMRQQHKLNERQKRNAGSLEYAFRHPMTPLAHKILDKYKKRSAVDVKKNQQKIREQIAKRRNRVRDKIQNHSRKANKRRH